MLPELIFDDKPQVLGAMGNYFSGQTTLNGEQLKTKSLAMTYILSSEPQLNELDDRLSKILSTGVQVSFDGYQLMLENNQYILTYLLAAPQYFR